MTDPIALLRADRAAAREREDPNANLCLLATVGDGEPHARMLVLRDVDERLALFFNANSAKAEELDQSKTVAIVVYLPSMAVQYRLTCDLRAIPPNIVADSWQLRPPIPKRLDWLYQRHPQGSAVESRERLVEMLAEMAETTPTTAPDSAIGYFLLPNAVERLHLAQPDGIHDRRRYRRDGGSWQEAVLVP